MFRTSALVPSIVSHLPGAVGARAATGSSAATPSTALAARPPAVDSSFGSGLERIGARFGAVTLGAVAVPVPLARYVEGPAAGELFLGCLLLSIGIFLGMELKAVAAAIKGLRDSQAEGAAKMVAAIGVQTAAINRQTAAIEDQTGAIREAAEAGDPLFGHEARLEEVTQQLFDAFTTCVGTERIDTTPAEKIEAAIGLIASLDTDDLRKEFPQQFLAAVLLGTLCELDAGRYDHAARYLAMAEKVKDRLNAHDQALLGLFVTYVIAKNSGDATEFVRVIENQGGALQVATFVRNTLAAVCGGAVLAAGNMVREFPAVQAMLGFIIAEAEAAKGEKLTSEMEKILSDARLANPFTAQDNLRSLLKLYAERKAYEALRGDLGTSVPAFMGQVGYGVSCSDAVYAKLVIKIALEFTRLDDVEGETKDRLRRWLRALVREFILASQWGIFAGKPGHDDNIRYIQAIENSLAGDSSTNPVDVLMRTWLEKQQS